MLSLFDITGSVWFPPMLNFLQFSILVARVIAAVLGRVAVYAGRFRLSKLGRTGSEDMFRARSVAVLAADILQMSGFLFGSKSAFVVHTNDVADNTFRIELRSGLFERRIGS